MVRPLALVVDKNMSSAMKIESRLRNTRKGNPREERKRNKIIDSSDHDIEKREEIVINI